jgi:hypothetical protein
MHKDSQHLTAMISRNGLYEFKGIPFGLKNGPAWFQQCVQNILGDSIYRHCFVFIDDIVIWGNDAEELIANAREVFAKLVKHRCKLKVKKCIFGARKVKYLGFIVMVTNKTEAGRDYSKLWFTEKSQGPPSVHRGVKPVSSSRVLSCRQDPFD